MSANKFKVKLPMVCAWCGSPDELTPYEINFSQRKNSPFTIKRRVASINLSLTFPICPQCIDKIERNTKISKYAERGGAILGAAGFLIYALNSETFESQYLIMSTASAAIIGLLAGKIIGYLVTRITNCNLTPNSWGKYTNGEFTFKNTQFRDQFAAQNPKVPLA